MVIPDSSLFNPASHQRFEEYNKVQKYKKYLLKEKLLHDIITVYTELEYENTDMNDTGGKNDYQWKNFLCDGAEEHNAVGTLKKDRDCNK